MKKTAIISLVLFVSILSTGCSTIIVRFGETGHEIYPATRLDTEFIDATWHGKGVIGQSYLMSSLTALDYPFSIVFDTLFLPVDLIDRYYYRKKKKEKLQQKDG